MGENDFVEDEEELYRNVRGALESEEYSYDDTGELLIQPGAFRDPGKQPSVDRAKFIGYSPSDALLHPSNGIVSLLAKDVRAIADVVTTTKDTRVKHNVDVVYDPIPKRPSHSVITVSPDFFDSNTKQRKAFKSLQKALARVATRNGWTLQPNLD